MNRSLATLAIAAAVVTLTAGGLTVSAFAAADGGGSLPGQAGWGGGEEPPQPLVGPVWLLTSLNDQSPAAGTTVYAEFGADGSVTGTDGCNRFRMPYTVTGSTISISGPGAGTLILCPPPIMEQADAFRQALASATTYSIAGSTLILIDGNGTVVATFMAQDQALAGTAWQVVNYNNGQGGVVTLINGTQITATFGADGRIVGSAGCNQYNAAYTTSGGTITVGAPASTRRFCAAPDGVMEQEGRYLTALQSAATYSIRGDLLEMRTADDALALILRRAG
jgi:heat shock protein HslJ